MTTLHRQFRPLLLPVGALQKQSHPEVLYEPLHLTAPDVHLVIVRACATAVGASGLVAGLVCVSSQSSSPRPRLQCAIAATTSAVLCSYYMRLYAIRGRGVRLGYSREGNSAIDALRYIHWSVCIALLAWLALLLRGPFPGGAAVNYQGLNYEEWLVAAPLLAALSVLTGICGNHSARSALKDAACSTWLWIAAGTAALIIGICTSLAVAYVIGTAPIDMSVRSTFEIGASKWISLLWFVHPIFGILRSSAAVLSDLNIGLRAQAFMPRAARLVSRTAREASLFSQRAYSAIVMGAHSAEEAAAITHLMGGAMADTSERTISIHPAAIAPWLVQLFDSTVAVIDACTVVYASVATSCFALQD